MTSWHKTITLWVKAPSTDDTWLGRLSRLELRSGDVNVHGSLCNVSTLHHENRSHWVIIIIIIGTCQLSGSSHGATEPLKLQEQRTNLKPRWETYVMTVLMVGGLDGPSTEACNTGPRLLLGLKNRRRVIKWLSWKLKHTHTLFWGSLRDDVWLVNWEFCRGFRPPALQKQPIKTVRSWNDTWNTFNLF